MRTLPTTNSCTDCPGDGAVRRRIRPGRLVRGLIPAIVAGCLLLPAAAAHAADAAPAWPQFGQDAAHRGVSPFDSPAPPYRQGWKFPLPDGARSISAPVVAGDTAVALGTRAVYGVNLADGSLRWQLARNGGSILATPAVAEVGGTPILLFTQGGTAGAAALVAYSLADPDVPSFLWQVPLRDRTTAGVSVDGDTAFASDNSGNVTAIELVNEVRHVDVDRHLVRWEHTVQGVVPTPPAVGGGKVLVVARNRTSGVVEVDALDEETGKEAWTATGAQLASSASAVTVDGDRAMVGFGEATGGGLLASIGLDDGQTDWDTRIASPFLPFTNIPVEGGHALALGTRLGVEAGLYRVDVATGRRSTVWNYGTDGLWSYEFDDSAVFASPVVVGGSVVLGFDDGGLAAVDVDSGVLVWRGDLGGSPVRGLAAADGVVVATIGTRRGGIVALENDPGAARLAEVSPSKPDWGRMLTNYAIAFAAVGAAAMIIGLALRSRRGPAAPPPEDEDVVDLAAEGEPA